MTFALSRPAVLTNRITFIQQFRILLWAQTRAFTYTPSINMPSSKGKPTDPELREQLKEGESPLRGERILETTVNLSLLSFCHLLEIKQEPNKSGGGEGQWSAWKVRFRRPPGRRRGGANQNPTHIGTALEYPGREELWCADRFPRRPNSPRSTRNREATTRTRLGRKTNPRRGSRSRKAIARRSQRQRTVPKLLPAI